MLLSNAGDDLLGHEITEISDVFAYDLGHLNESLAVNNYAEKKKRGQIAQIDIGPIIKGRLLANMPRSVRVEYAGAIYHVINRGNYRSGIFELGRSGGSEEAGGDGAFAARGIVHREQGGEEGLMEGHA